MKVICFPHYTCGGLLCDMLNNTFSSIGNHGGLMSIAHSLGKVGDTESVMVDYDINQITNHIKSLNTTQWVGTHAWPGNWRFADFEKIIVVTTATSRSKLYRWLRAYHLYYRKTWAMTGMELTDKIRETAKNYIRSFDPVYGPNIVNLEFAEVVENKKLFQKIVNADPKHLDRWKNFNYFLYAEDLWNSIAVKAYYEAEYEMQLQEHYIYE